MKAKHLFLTALLLLAGCSFIWSPTATAKKFMSGAEKGDLERIAPIATEILDVVADGRNEQQIDTAQQKRGRMKGDHSRKAQRRAPTCAARGGQQQ